ncbi:MAG TPA: hypothetical protein VFZ66_10865 [Herpetosiphonaceae bacterium]
MELLALILFIGMIGSWLMMPGTTTTRIETQAEAGERSPSTAGQPA